MRKAMMLWLYVYLYVIVVGFLVQFVLLPFMFPQAHWGEGLMVGGDWILFHKEAVQLANRIESYGWKEWSLYGSVSGQIMSGITAFFYALTGIHKPWVMLFYNGFLWAYAVLFLYLTLSELNFSEKSSLLAILPFAVFPSNLTWNAQIHRDGLYILGFILLFYSIIASKNVKSLKKVFSLWVLSFIGIFLISLARKHMVLVIYYVTLFLTIAVIMVIFIKTANLILKKIKILSFVEFKPYVSIISILLVLFISSYILQPQSQSQTVISWKRSWWLPEKIDNMLRNIADWRYRFLNEYFKDAAGNVDRNFIPESAIDFIFYLPRAYTLGFFSPFPDTWFKKSGSAGGTIARYITPFETLIIWLGLLLFALWFVKTKAHLNPTFVCIFFICLVLVYLHVVTEPNLGPIYRKRYVFVMFLVSIGYASFLEKFLGKSHEKNNTYF